MQTKDHYKEAGVDIEAGDALVEWLKDNQAVYRGPYGRVLGGVGGFASLFKTDFKALKDPHLVSCTDGVGTKVLLGVEQGKVRDLGQDLVGMCVNDLYTLGAQPLFFLDYFASGKLDKKQFSEVLLGINQALTQCGCALIGGETAEMPGLYGPGHFDLAGFVVGVVDGERLFKPEAIKDGDLFYALPSSGFHSNGYSLLRKWLKDQPSLVEKYVDKLLIPTKIYHEVPDLIAKNFENIRGIAHVTGGGISGNLPRVLPDGVEAWIEKAAVKTPAWMLELFQDVGVSPWEVEPVFNLGCGMILCIAAEGKEHFEGFAKEAGLGAFALGNAKRAADAAAEAKVVYS